MTLRDAATPLNIALLVLLAAATIAGFVLVPAGTILPIHWGVSGEPDGFLPRDGALLLIPIIAIFVLALLFGVQRFVSEERRQASRHAIAAVIPTLLILFTAIQAATVMIGTGQAVDMVRIVVALVGLMFVVLGNVMPKTQPNWIAGFRLPWTLRDAANWQATHRLGGLLMMLGGAAMVVAALVTGSSVALLIVTVIALFGSIAATIAYSFALSRR